MKKTIHYAASLLLSVTLLSSLAGCASQNKNITPDSTTTAYDGQNSVQEIQPHVSGDIEEIKIAISIGTPHANPVVLADQKDFFQDEGLNAKILSFASGVATMEALPSGAWDICIAAIPGWIGGSINYNLKIIGMGPWDEDGIDLYVRPDSDIAKAGKGQIDGYPDIYGTPDLWKGKTVLLPTGTTSHMTLIATLSAMGLTESDVTINNIDVAAGYTAFKAGQGDILGSWTVHSVYNQNDGNIAASSATAAGFRIPIVICASEKVMKENPAIVEKFMRVYAKGAAYQEEHKEEAAQIMADYNNKNGFKTDYDSCFALIEKRSTPPYSEQIKLFQDGEMERMVKDNFDFFVGMGKYEQSSWDILKANIDSSMLEKVSG